MQQGATWEFGSFFPKLLQVQELIDFLMKMRPKDKLLLEQLLAYCISQGNYLACQLEDIDEESILQFLKEANQAGSGYSGETDPATPRIIMKLIETAGDFKFKAKEPVQRKPNFSLYPKKVRSVYRIDMNALETCILRATAHIDFAFGAIADYSFMKEVGKVSIKMPGEKQLFCMHSHRLNSAHFILCLHDLRHTMLLHFDSVHSLTRLSVLITCLVPLSSHTGTLARRQRNPARRVSTLFYGR